MSIADYKDSIVRFNTKAPGVLGAARDNVKVVAVLDYDTAALLEDVRAKHARVRNYIPSLPQAAGAYNYVRILYSNGEYEILGVPWIDENTIEVISSRKLVITIEDVSDSTETLARQALLQNGISNFTFEVVGTTATPT